MADQPARPDDGAPTPPPDADRPSPETATAAPPPGRPWGMMALAVLLAIIAGGATAYFVFEMRPLPAPPVQQAAPAGASSESVQALETRIAAIETKLGTLESVGGAAQRGHADQMAAMVARVQSIERYLGELGQKVDRRGIDPGVADAVKVVGERLTALEGEMKRLAEAGARSGEDPATTQARESAIAALKADTERRLAELSQKNEALAKAAAEAAARADAAVAAAQKTVRSEARGDRASALVLAIGQLRETLRGARPFAAELETVQALAGDRPGYGEPLSALSAHAARGVPTRDALALRFDPLAQLAARAAIAPEGAGWVDHTLARLSGLVTIRRTGEDPTDTRPTAAIARAEARLELGDLAGAVDALGTLDGAPAQVLAEWLADAKARLAVERAAAALTTQALADLGTAAASAPAQ